MKKCKNCKWFEDGEEHGGDGNECFLNPPIVYQEEHGVSGYGEDDDNGYNYHSTRPTVDETDFCQFFEQKNK